MKHFRWLVSGCAAWILSTASLWGQAAPVQVRVRAIAGEDGKVEVVEETVEGDPKEGSEAKKFREPKATGEEKDIRTTVIRRVQQAVRGEHAEEEPAKEEELPTSEYWIGVQIGTIPPEVRKHMSVKHGILVQHVYPDSPAAKAELQADDVLLQADDSKIEGPADLIKAVDAVKTKKLTLRLLREGTEKTMTVTPIKRPMGESVETLALRVPMAQRYHEAQAELERALAKLKEQNAKDAGVDFMLVRPGAYVHGRSAAPAKLPDDVTIQITKEGNKPASVKIVQGERTYEATEGKLEKVPAELRPHVERMLSGGPTIMSYTPGDAYRQFEYKVAPQATGPRAAPRVAVPPTPAAPRVPGVAPYPVAPPVPTPPAPPASPARVAWLRTPVEPADAKLDQILKKLDSLSSPDLEDMKKELKSLRKEIDELRKKSSGSESSREK
jgi:membrane-associated protease RseP (regulator of RpoE activity)